MNKQIKKYRIKWVSLSRYVLQEWSIWFPFWIQVDLTRYQLIDKIAEASASTKSAKMVDPYSKVIIRPYQIVNFILAVILLLITGCNVQMDNRTSYKKATGSTLTRKYMVLVKFSGNQTNQINISAILESCWFKEMDKQTL